MQRTVYDKRSFRRLERKTCAVSDLFGDAVGGCRGSIHRHHTDPEDENSRTVELCARHHAQLHAALHTFADPEEKVWKRCGHDHAYAWSREQCEKRLNSAA